MYLKMRERERSTYRDLHFPAFLVGGSFAAVAICLSVFLILQHLRFYTNPSVCFLFLCLSTFCSRLGIWLIDPNFGGIYNCRSKNGLFLFCSWSQFMLLNRYVHLFFPLRIEFFVMQSCCFVFRSFPCRMQNCRCLVTF